MPRKWEVVSIVLLKLFPPVLMTHTDQLGQDAAAALATVQPTAGQGRLAGCIADVPPASQIQIIPVRYLKNVPLTPPVGAVKDISSWLLLAVSQPSVLTLVYLYVTQTF